MWFHLDTSDYKYRHSGIATSPSPNGPFTFVKAVQPDGIPSLDMSLFKDPADGTACVPHREREKTTNTAHFTACLLDFASTAKVPREPMRHLLLRSSSSAKLRLCCLVHAHDVCCSRASASVLSTLPSPLLDRYLIRSCDNAYAGISRLTEDYLDTTGVRSAHTPARVRKLLHTACQLQNILCVRLSFFEATPVAAAVHSCGKRPSLANCHARPRCTPRFPPWQVISTHDVFEGMALFRLANGTYYVITSHLTGYAPMFYGG